MVDPRNTQEKVSKQRHVRCACSYTQGFLRFDEGVVLFLYHWPTRSPPQEWKIRTNWSLVRNQGNLRLPHTPFFC